MEGMIVLAPQTPEADTTLAVRLRDKFMSTGRCVLAASVLDQEDILQDFIDWYQHIGVDFILILDLGSTDGSRDLLARLADTDKVGWYPLPDRDMTKYDQAGELAKLARDRFQADWIVLCDADEFLCPAGGALGPILRLAESKDITSISVPCLNMTGPQPKPGQSATQALTLRIDAPAKVTPLQATMGNLPVPYIFIEHPPHTIVRASAVQAYGGGAHYVETSWGLSGETERLRFLHYNMRGYGKFEQKVRNAAAWIRDNKHLDPLWAWHWRRWIWLYEAGRLREDYEAQFVSSAREQELIQDGTCSRDETVARWKRERPK
jgi:hypothetical protein